MNDKLITLLLETLNDEIAFNIKLQYLITKRNRVVTRALNKMKKALEEVK